MKITPEFIQKALEKGKGRLYRKHLLKEPDKEGVVDVRLLGALYMSVGWNPKVPDAVSTMQQLCKELSVSEMYLTGLLEGFVLTDKDGESDFLRIIEEEELNGIDDGQRIADTFFDKYGRPRREAHAQMHISSTGDQSR
jgi:hypothetical protein